MVLEGCVGPPAEEAGFLQPEEPVSLLCMDYMDYSGLPHPHRFQTSLASLQPRCPQAPLTSTPLPRHDLLLFPQSTVTHNLPPPAHRNSPPCPYPINPPPHLWIIFSSSSFSHVLYQGTGPCPCGGRGVVSGPGAEGSHSFGPGGDRAWQNNPIPPLNSLSPESPMSPFPAFPVLSPAYDLYLDHRAVGVWSQGKGLRLW